jgi:hypothetical protein
MTPKQLEKILESNSKKESCSLSQSERTLLKEMFSNNRTNLDQYLEDRLEMLDKIDSVPEEVRFTVSIPLDAHIRLEYFAKLLSHSKSGLANDILEAAIYDLQEKLCGDIYDDTEQAEAHRKALGVGAFDAHLNHSKNSEIELEEIKQ